MRAPEQKCPDCGGLAFVTDWAAGDVVCKGCGLVVEAHIIDERCEWRTFSDQDAGRDDPCRVGAPSNPILGAAEGLGTMIGKTIKDGSFTLNRVQQRNHKPSKALQAALHTIEELVDRLRLANGETKTAACELYKLALDSDRLRGRNSWAVCAACVFLACRQKNTPRTLKEIAALGPAEVRQKHVNAQFKMLVDLMKDSGKEVDTVTQAHVTPTAQHPADYMKRFTAELRLGFDMYKACRDMAIAAKPMECITTFKSKPHMYPVLRNALHLETKDGDQAVVKYPWDARAPVSVAASILYILTLIKDGVTMQEIVIVTGVTEPTVKAVYRDLYPHLAKLLPAGFNSPQQIAKLPAPDRATAAAIAASTTVGANPTQMAVNRAGIHAAQVHRGTAQVHGRIAQVHGRIAQVHVNAARISGSAAHSTAQRSVATLGWQQQLQQACPGISDIDTMILGMALGLC